MALNSTAQPVLIQFHADGNTVSTGHFERDGAAVALAPWAAIAWR